MTDHVIHTQVYLDGRVLTEMVERRTRMNRKAKGTTKERKSRDLFTAEGWKVIRPGASIGAADLICMKAGECPLAVQVKCNAGSPYMNFRPAERTELERWANEAGCVAVLAYWAPRARTHKLYEPAEWPS